MAAKTSKKPRKSDDKVKALVVATLKRAIAVVEGSMADKSTKPAEGAYPVALELAIAGDITVGKETPAGDDREVPTLDASHVLAGLVDAARGDKAKAAVVTKGAAAYRDLERSKGTGAKDAVDYAEGLVAQVCESIGAMKTVPTPGRAGAVQGKPSVTIHGTHGGNALSLEVAAA